MQKTNIYAYTHVYYTILYVIYNVILAISKIQMTVEMNETYSSINRFLSWSKQQYKTLIKHYRIRVYIAYQIRLVNAHSNKYHKETHVRQMNHKSRFREQALKEKGWRRMVVCDSTGPLKEQAVSLLPDYHVTDTSLILFTCCWTSMAAKRMLSLLVLIVRALQEFYVRFGMTWIDSCTKWEFVKLAAKYFICLRWLYSTGDDKMAIICVEL